MDADMGFLGLTTMTYNFFYRAGARTIRDVVKIIENKGKRNIPESCIKEARNAIEMQENILRIKLREE